MGNVIKFKNANIYDTDETKFKLGSIVIEDGVIENINFNSDNTYGDTYIDLNKKYIIPGMVDVHTHGRVKHDFNYLKADSDVERMCRSYAEVGTTTIFATLATSEFHEYINSINIIKSSAEIIGAKGYANIDGFHFEGRYINVKRKGAHNQDLLSPLVSAEIAELLELTKPYPAHVTFAPELVGGDDFLQTILNHGATAAIGHSDATYDEAVKAFKAGITAVTHTFNAMSPLHHREPGTVGAALTNDVYTEVICDGFHLHPACVKLLYLAKKKDKITLITDSMEATGCEDGTYAIAGMPVYVKDGKALTAEGTIAGSTLNLFDGVKNMAAFCDLSLEDVLPFATANPAAMVGIDDITGKLTQGLRADFLILEDDKKSIADVYCGGKKLN